MSGDRVSIDSELEDDVFASGGVVNINAPVDGAVVSGGRIRVNAPIRGDLFVAGGQIFIDADVEGKIVAAGGTIDINGNAKNVVASGGNINIHSGVVIEKDAFISGGVIEHSGDVKGKLLVRGNEFLNMGNATTLDAQEGGFFPSLDVFMNIMLILVTVGFFILGIVIIKLFPKQFLAVDNKLREKPAVNILVGFVMILVSAAVIILLAITLIGLPLAAIMAMLFIISLMLSTIFVSHSLGKKIINWFGGKGKPVFSFILGTIVLIILSMLPIIGWVILAIAVSLGYGAIFYSVRAYWPKIKGKK
jgi:hypothetical protein